jgi:D-glycero-D-manno-heptose 1,7-bisphosphate phosphatase
MLLQACQDHHIDPHRSYLIGDRTTDVDAARSSGVRPVLVLTGYGEHEKNRVGADVPVVADVLSAVRLIVEEKETAP